MEAEIGAPGVDMAREASAEGSGERTTREGAIDDRPRSVYELVTRQMLLELKEDIAEIKGRVNTLLWLLAGAIVVELLMRLMR